MVQGWVSLPGKTARALATFAARVTPGDGKRMTPPASERECDRAFECLGAEFDTGSTLGATAESLLRLQMKHTAGLVCGNAPHSAASIRGLASAISREFEQGLSRMVESVGREQMTHRRFRGLISGLRGLLAGIGRETLAQILGARDEARPSVEVAGERLRYRGLSAIEWLTEARQNGNRRRGRAVSTPRALSGWCFPAPIGTARITFFAAINHLALTRSRAATSPATPTARS